MTDTVADLQLQLSRLRKARANGLRMTARGENRVEYKSDAEMAAAESALIDRIDRLSGGNGGSPRRVRYLYQSGKGL